MLIAKWVITSKVLGRCQGCGGRGQELRIAPAKSLKTVRWVGSVREEQIRKAVFGRWRRAEKTGRERERHRDQRAPTAARKAERGRREKREGRRAGGRVAG